MTTTDLEIRQPDRGAVALPMSMGSALIREAAATMADAHALAVAICQTQMVPKHLFKKPEETAAVMLYGATLDMDPMQSVRAIYVVHGQPGLYARNMVALTLRHGHQVWTVESTDDSVTVAGRRAGSDHVESSTWTIARATKAGYVPTIDPKTGKYRLNEWGKLEGNEKYLTDPQSMLYAKAASEVCRKIAPDVLTGVYAVEELQMERWDAEVTEVRRDAPAGGGLASIVKVEQVEPETTEGGGDRPASAPEATEEPARAATPPPSVPETETADKPMTKRTQGQLFALFGKKGVVEAEQLSGVNYLCGKEYASRSQITEADARLVIEVLKKRPDVTVDVAAPEGGE